MNGAELLVSALENEGVQQIFGVPGEENLDLVEALRRSSIKLVVTRHEQAAAFIAATHGRLTGEPGVCLSTLGPGALNLTTGAAYALLGAMPMIMITGQKGVLSSKQARFQVVDIVSTMTPLTKMARQIISPATIHRTCGRLSGSRRKRDPGPSISNCRRTSQPSRLPRWRRCRATRSRCRWPRVRHWTARPR
jgi:acetolactate synthase-1/2/3 large subunit